jgi:hypothetical protein
VLEETTGRISTCCSREQIGQFWSRWLWRQKVGTTSVLAIRSGQGHGARHKGMQGAGPVPYFRLR